MRNLETKIHAKRKINLEDYGPTPKKPKVDQGPNVDKIKQDAYPQPMDWMTEESKETSVAVISVTNIIKTEIMSIEINSIITFP